jgi:thioester reductase-like protein
MAYLLLTGATGLLGGYLLRDLLRQGLPVAVVVRRTAALSARRRIDAVLAPFETERALPRPIVLEGDLAKPQLGLSDADRGWLREHCNAVLHSAASISFYREEKSGEPYRTNVDGTRNLIELCQALGIDEFHHVSTAYVCGQRSGRVLEGDLDVGQQHGNDYERSKVAAEKLVHAANFRQPPTIYRPSIIVGDSQTGYTTTFHGYYTPIQIAWWLAKAGVLQSGVDDWFLAQLGLKGHERKNIVPVDWVSQVIAQLVMQPAAHGRTYHVTCDQPPSAMDLALAIGDVLKPRLTQPGTSSLPESAPTDLLEAADFRRHMDVYRAYFRDHPEFDTTNLKAALPELPCPTVDRAMLARTGAYALNANFGWPRTLPRTPPVDLNALIEHYPVQAQSDHVCLLEVTGLGGGAWTFDLVSQSLVSAGRPERPAASIRLRSDTLAALVAGRSVDALAAGGRIMICGTTEATQRAAALLEALVAFAADQRPAAEARAPWRAAPIAHGETAQ